MPAAPRKRDARHGHTSDGYINIATTGGRIWERCAEAIGAPEFVADPDYATAPARSKNRDALNAKISKLTERKAAALIEGLPAEVVMADTAYDADHLRQAIAAKGALAVIPNNPSRALKYPLDKHLYAQRHLVECCFSKLKQFRRVATRFEKTARNYRAVVTLAAIVWWMR